MSKDKSEVFFPMLLSDVIGSAIQVPCTSTTVICPQMLTEFTCKINVIYLDWIVPKIDSNDNSLLALQLVAGHPTDHSSTMGIYSASIVQDNDVYVSTLTFVGPLEVNNDNMEITCQGVGTGAMSCPFIIEGIIITNFHRNRLSLEYLTDKPSSPINVTVMAIDTDTVNLSWSLDVNSSYCIDHHNATVSVDGNTVQNPITNLTSTVITGLEHGLDYSFSVRAVDYAGREGTISESVTITMNGMIKITVEKKDMI